jgi:gamma-glutamyl phosphate reductase
MAATATSVSEICERARAASRMLARVDTATKNAALLGIAAALRERTE